MKQERPITPSITNNEKIAKRTWSAEFKILEEDKKKKTKKLKISNITKLIKTLEENIKNMTTKTKNTTRDRDTKRENEKGQLVRCVGLLLLIKPKKA